MKATSSKPETSAAGTYLSLIGAVSTPMNGSSKRKSSNSGSWAGSNKKRTVYMDLSDDDDEPTISQKVNGSALNGARGPAGNKKEKGHAQGKNMMASSIQEQRKQLPIAQG